MADGSDSANGADGRRPWDVVVSTVADELVGLAFCGVVALLTWPFGWLPDPALVAFAAGVFAVRPAAERYRAGPRRRSAVVVAVLGVAVVTLLVAAAAGLLLPPSAGRGVGLLVGFVVAAPVGAAVLARLLDRADGD
ncbi:hypothetical protein AB0G87_11880 [Streptomyces asoensis]|uniref:hypothetical protein n=1 Tax=Streptomyces asoensis TaxID=249586 RepID=UPI0033DFA3F4